MNRNKIKQMKPEFIDKLPDLDICLMCLQGSRMLGLQVSEDADYDYRGVFVASNEDLLSLNNKPNTTVEGGSYEDDEMEYVFHEVEKFFNLSIKGNPSVIHLFFVPTYNYMDDIGRMIISNKNVFLNEPSIRSAFGGYAMSQMLYLKRNRGNAKRKEKHVRHCFRLFDTGMELLKTGHITLPLKEPEYYLELGPQIHEPDGLEKLLKLFEEKDKEFQACPSVLPKEPDLYMAGKMLLKIRNL